LAHLTPSGRRRTGVGRQEFSVSDPASQAIVDRLRAAAGMKERAVIAELAHAPVESDGISRSCENCIYFLARRSWCDLPELDIPVDPEWYCALWRV
jgi:hypothetical protein